MGIVESAVVGTAVGAGVGGAAGYGFVRISERTFVEEGGQLPTEHFVLSAREAGQRVGQVAGACSGATVGTASAICYGDYGMKRLF